MTELHFKGKEFVYNHHLTVPHRPLEMHADKGIGDPRLDGNLIIQGDNLHALKALLPIYAGKVDCIFIDPPYNTGKERWAYNDNVNSPMIKEWLASNPIGIDDGLRHDKWCAMMWPRLMLLRELLSESGSIWITCDDNEVHRLREVLDEVFGVEAFAAIFVVENNRKGRNDKENVALTHEYMIVYSHDEYLSRGLELTEEQIAEYNQTTANGRKYMTRDLRKRGSEDRREDRESMYFPIYWDRNSNVLSMEKKNDSDAEILPMRGDGSDGRWRWGKKRVEDNLIDLVPRESAKGRFDIDYRVFLDEDEEDDEKNSRKKPKSVWFGPPYSTDYATTLIKQIFGSNPLKHSPKALEHIVRVVQLAAHKDAIILDSFAGSGTTAHAVLEANRRDGGNRRFVLVEMEDYANDLTAERIRRVISGYDFDGKQRVELLRQRITWTKLKKADELLDDIEKIENLHGHEYDDILKVVKDGELVVTGEKTEVKHIDGLGGEFTYCTLGDSIEMDKILTGETLPPFVDLATVLFHTATNLPGDPAVVNADTFYMGEANGQMLWLVYKPELDWLKTPEAAMSLSFSRKIAEGHPSARHLVFAPANHTNPKMLAKEGLKVEFAPLPYALYRVEKA